MHGNRSIKRMAAHARHLVIGLLQLVLNAYQCTCLYCTASVMCGFEGVDAGSDV